MRIGWCTRFSVGLVLLASFSTRGPTAIAEEPGPKNVARGGESSQDYSPTVAAASQEGEWAIPRIRVPAGFQVELFAAEPLLANPVAFSIDERGRVYVVETFRLHAGVTDIRQHMDWLDDDLAARTVDDRLAMYRKFLGETLATYGTEHDRLRRIEDTDGDHQADRATVFADGFHGADEGLAAGVLARGQQVWFSNIPHLWSLTDEDGDGVAESRRSLSSGYGVHVGFLGHDLHGLRMGPDGMLYFSIGDRGFRVETEGRLLDHPDSGAVLRCRPDGTHLEVVHSGLRNPQELAFDEFGNLFTCDNNSDSGDQARVVQIVEGGDSGWRIGYQFIESPTSRGPWNAEKLWHPRWDGQAACIVPPLANLASGPSGLCYDPGTGLTAKYRKHFFLADFRGTSVNSGIRSFALQPRGATFEVVDQEEFAWSVLATDVDFGVDGALYISDWVEGWGMPGKGRIYRVLTAETEQDPLVREVQQQLAAGFGSLEISRLAELLTHADQRLRQEAQFELVTRATKSADSVQTLVDVARNADHQLARVHAIWGLGQIAWRDEHRELVCGTALALLASSDDEIRAQAARLLGQVGTSKDRIALIPLLADATSRVRLQAALSLGKLPAREAIDGLRGMLEENQNRDPYLRHAAVMGLAACASEQDLLDLASDQSQAVRLGLVLALRRQASPRIAALLNDVDPLIVEECARAIHDLPIEAAMPALAALHDRPGLSEPVLRRVIDANLRIGGADAAAALASLAARDDIADEQRCEALDCLEQWAAPSSRDRVVGLWRPIAARDAAMASRELSRVLGAVFSGSDRVRTACTKAASSLGIREVLPLLRTLVADQNRAADARVVALTALGKLEDANLGQIVEQALADREPTLRSEAQRLLIGLDPARALGVLDQVLEGGTTVERQNALAALAKMASEPADAILLRWLDRSLDRRTPPEIELDLVLAARERNTESFQRRLDQFAKRQRPDDALAEFRATLQGGNAERGRKVFQSKADVYCARCHKVGERGGDVGPDLSKIGAEKTREYLLESIVVPNKEIAKGFESVVVATTDGQILTGVFKGEDELQLRLVTPEGSVISIPKDQIDERSRGQSAMPDKLLKLLSPLELRDLIEFLASLKPAP